MSLRASGFSAGDTPERKSRRSSTDPIPPIAGFGALDGDHRATVSSSYRITQLATFSARATPSPSPEPSSTPPLDEAVVLTPRQQLLKKGREKLNKILNKSGEAKVSKQPLPRSRSMPSSPRISRSVPSTPRVVTVSETFVMDEPRALRPMVDDSHDYASCDSEKSTDDVADKKNRRHSTFIADAINISASGTIEFGAPDTAPLVRVRSHSSVGDLKRRLQAERDSASSSSTPSSETSSTDSTSSSSPSPIVSPLLRRLSSSGRNSKLLTYSLIYYHASPVVVGPWQRFLVPNSLIDFKVRTYLEQATRSETLDQSFIICACVPNCVEHASPDTLAKLAAIYLLDANILHRRDLRPFFRILSTGLKVGSWATMYRIGPDVVIDAVKKPVTFEYRFKMFV